MDLDKKAIENASKVKKLIFGKKKSSKKKKKTSHGNVVIGAVLALIVIAVFIFYSDKIFVKEDLSEKSFTVAASVNGEIITIKEIDDLYEKLPPQMGLSITKDDLLEQLVERKLLLQEAKKQSVIVTDEDVTGVVDELKAQFPTEEIFNDVLRQQNIELDELNEQIIEQLLLSNLLEGVIGKPDVTEEEIEVFFNENPVENVSLEDVKDRIEEILVLQKQQQAYEEYMVILRQDAEISYDSDIEVGFLECLKGKGVKIYSADWCEFTKKQEEFVGDFEDIYVRCEDINRNETGLCEDIGGYPTWKINNEKHVGVLSKNKLTELSGCE